MKQKIKVLIADSCFLTREGLRALLEGMPEVEISGEAAHPDELHGLMSLSTPDLVIINYSSSAFPLAVLLDFTLSFKGVNILAVTDYPEKMAVTGVLKAGVAGHILTDCDQQEMIDAVYSAGTGDRFFCGKILAAVKNADEGAFPSCEPLNLTQREVEIIKKVAEGRTNKEIADQLCLSAHTVMTHRRNIMAKLGINNTAGIVMYAVKENIISPNKFLFSPVG